MKKIKIMLTAMIVIGTVGGVLAFKSKRVGFYCTRSTVNGVCPAAAKCPNGVVGNINASATPVCYTITEVISGCSSTTACNKVAKIQAE